MSTKIAGTPFVLPTAEEAQKLVEEAFANSGVPVQASWIAHQKKRVVKKLEDFLECLGQMGTKSSATSDKPAASRS